MNGLLITNNDQHARTEIADLFNGDDYWVTTADSVTDALAGIMDKSIQVVLLSGSFDEKYVSKFIPLLKKCNRNLSIILVSDDMPLELLRLIRKEGIFYHALKPTEDESWEEIRQVVRCAFENYRAQQQIGCRGVYKKLIFRGAKTVLTSLVLWLVMSPQVFASESANVFGGNLMMLIFSGFAALLFAFQLVPAVLLLFGPIERISYIDEGVLNPIFRGKMD